MGDITKNISRNEFTCRCGCGLNDMHPATIMGVQAMCDQAGSRVLITGGCRCTEHNKNEGGSEASHHLPDAAQRGSGYSDAIDLVLPGVPLRVTYSLALTVPQFANGGIGVYPGDDDNTRFLHVDCRGYRARWGKVGGVFVTAWEALRVLDERQGR